MTAVRTLALVKKELLQFWRNPPLIAVVLWAFTIDVYLCAQGFSFDVQNFPIAIYNRDLRQPSAALLEHLRLPRFRLVEVITDESQIDELLLTGRAMMVIVINDDFSRKLARGERAPVQVILDGTNSNSAALALSHVAEIFSEVEIKDVNANGIPRVKSPISFRPRIAFNENMESSWYVGLSELFSSMTMVAMLLPAAAAVREKEYGTIEQLLVSPMHSWQIMLAKIVPMTGIALVFTLISVFAVLGGGFGVYPKGSLVLFLAATAIYVYACSGLGMLLATLARNLSQVIVILTTAFVPIVFLSGTWTPAEAMPPALRWFTYVSPLSYYLDIGTGIFFRNWGLQESFRPLAMLAMLGGGLFVVGTARIGRQFA